jgi:hypothetical protein
MSQPFKVTKVYFSQAVVAPWDEVVSSLQEWNDRTRVVALTVDWPLLKVHVEVPESDSHDGYEHDAVYNMAHVTRFDPEGARKPLKKKKAA